MTFFWSKVYGLLGKTPYIYPRYQVWGVMDLGFDFWILHWITTPPYPSRKFSLLQSAHSCQICRLLIDKGIDSDIYIFEINSDKYQF